MREEFYRCNKQLPFSLAIKLFSAPSMAVQMGEDNEMSMGAGGVVEKRNNNKHNKNNENCDDLMFEIEL